MSNVKCKVIQGLGSSAQSRAKNNKDVLTARRRSGKPEDVPVESKVGRRSGLGLIKNGICMHGWFVHKLLINL